MAMDQRQAIRKVKEFARIVRPHLPVCDILLYGSYAAGRPHRFSDIDVAVVIDEYKGDLFGMKARLFRLRREIDVRIEPLLLERKHDPANFLGEIVRTGKVIASYN
jgi:predicted nucleotidyltransferase